jgi:hypothetical protein
MEMWSWVLVVVALVLLLAGTLRFDLLLPALRERLGGSGEPDAGASDRAAAAAVHGHGAAAHTGHVAAHGGGRRRSALHRGGRRH